MPPLFSRDPDDSRRNRGKQKAEVIDHYELEEEEDEDDFVRPPKDLLQTARDVLERPVSLAEVMRVWDTLSDQKGQDARVQACLEKLLAAGGEPRAAANSGARDDSAKRTAGSSARRAVGLTANRSIVEIGDSSDEEQDRRRPLLPSSDSDVELITPLKRNKERLAEAAKKRKTSEVEIIVTTKEKARGPESSRKRPRECSTISSADTISATSRSASTSARNEEGQAKAGKRRKTNDAEHIHVSQEKARAPEPTGKRPREPSATSSGETSSGTSRASSTSATTPGTPEIQTKKARAASAAPAHGSARKEKEETSVVAEISAMVPDVDPAHVNELAERYAGYSVQATVSNILDTLFKGEYPKSLPVASTSASGSGKGKGKASATSEGDDIAAGEKKYMDIEKRERVGPEYYAKSFDFLQADFPNVPVSHIRKVAGAKRYFFAPAYQQLLEDSRSAACPYKVLQITRKDKGKGKAHGDDSAAAAEVVAEREWILKREKRKQALLDAKLAEEQAEKEEEEAGHVMECGCCFTDFVLSKMIQCPEAHLFCRTCAQMNAETIIGQRKIDIECMDADGCKACFSNSELTKCLKPTTMTLLEKMRAEKAVGLAELEGFATCPFCPWGVVIDNPEERLFRCGNEECMKVTCRNCKKADHLPKTCEEYDADLKANNIHKVAEAMTEALLKKCPKCSVPMVKTDGCNKMRCSNCQAMSCYVCGKAITGYDHFERRQANPNGPEPAGKLCPLWENTAARQDAEVEAARQAAAANVLETAAANGIEVDREQLEKLKAEARPPQQPIGPGPMPYVMYRPQPVPPPAAAYAPPNPAGLAQNDFVRQYEEYMMGIRAGVPVNGGQPWEQFVPPRPGARRARRRN